MYHRQRRQTSVSSHPARGAWIEIPLFVSAHDVIASHPARGAWIEISLTGRAQSVLCRRTPHGVRGLKLYVLILFNSFVRRTPHGVRGLKLQRNYHTTPDWGRTPHGVRGLKLSSVYTVSPTLRRAPHGARGLKSQIAPNEKQRLDRRAPCRTPPTADAPDCKCSPGRSYKRKACSAERTRSEARGHRRATGEEVP